MKAKYNSIQRLDSIGLFIITFALTVSAYLLFQYPELKSCSFCAAMRALQGVLFMTYCWRMFIKFRELSFVIQLFTALVGLIMVLRQFYRQPERLKTVLDSMLNASMSGNFKLVLSSYLSLGSLLLFLVVLLFSLIQINQFQKYSESK